MPIIKSAKKRVKQTAKATARNMRVRKGLREAVKSLQEAIATGNSTKIRQSQSKVDSTLDVATKKGLFHKNKTARKKAQIAKLVKESSKAKPAPKKAVTKKVAPVKKKTVVKKAAANKKAVDKKLAKAK